MENQKSDLSVPKEWQEKFFNQEDWGRTNRNINHG